MITACEPVRYDRSVLFLRDRKIYVVGDCLSQIVHDNSVLNYCCCIQDDTCTQFVSDHLFVHEKSR